MAHFAWKRLDPFDIRNFTERLTPAKGKNRYICPVCNNDNLTIDPKTGKYQCWTGCACKEIRDALAPLNQNHLRQHAGSRRPQVLKEIKRQLPPPPPADSEINIVRLTETPTDTPKPYKGFEKKHGEVSKIDYTYATTENGEPLRWVVRTEYPDNDKPKGYSKKFCPCHRAVENEPAERGVLDDGKVGITKYAKEGETLYTKGEGIWEAYRESEALALAKLTPGIPVVLTNEGEKGTEIARSHLLASISWLGSAWKVEDMIPTLERLKVEVPNAIPVCLTDNDKPGRNKGQTFLEACAAAGIYGIVIPSTAIDPDICEHGDIEQILEKMSAEELITLLKEQIQEYVNNAQQIEDEPIATDEPKDKQDKPSAPEIADEIAEDYKSKLCWSDTYRCWMMYEIKQHGIWSAISDEYLNHIILFICKGKGLTPTSKFVKEVTALLQMILIKCDWEQQAKVIPFQNGVLDIETKAFSPHAYHNYITWCLPYDYNLISSDWGAIDKFLDELSGNNPQSKDILIKFAAATLFGRCDLHKFLWLTGDGGTGKGTYTRLLELMIGVDNCAFPSLAELQEKDVIASLISKRLIIISDQEKYSGSLSNFCKLTGGDTMSGRHLYKNRINFRYSGMIAGTSNQPIFHNDSGGRITRRLLLLACNNKPSVIRDLEAEFKPLIPAFIAYLINIPQAEIETTLRGNQGKGGGITSTAWAAKIRLDSIAAWLNEEIVRDAGATSYIGNDREECTSVYDPTKATLFGAYNRYCKQSGLQAKGKNNFSADLMDICKILAWGDVGKKRDSFGRVVVGGIRLRRAEDESPTIEDLLSESLTEDPKDLTEDLTEDLKPSPLRQSEDPEDLCSQHLEKSNSNFEQGNCSDQIVEQSSEQSSSESLAPKSSESSESLKGKGFGSSDRSSDRSSGSKPIEPAATDSAQNQTPTPAQKRTWQDDRREAYQAKQPKVQPAAPTEIGVGALVESKDGFLGGVQSVGDEPDTWMVLGTASYLDEVSTRCYPASQLRLR